MKISLSLNQISMNFLVLRDKFDFYKSQKKFENVKMLSKKLQTVNFQE